MPGPLVPAIIYGATALASTIGSAIAKKKQAKRQREHEIEQQRLANEYNAPKAQMERFKEANLNPNLIYGSSPAGAAGEFAAREGREIEIQGEGPTIAGGIAQGAQQGILAYYQQEQHRAGIDRIEAATRKDQLANDRQAILNLYENRNIPDKVKQEMAQLSTKTQLLELEKRAKDIQVREQEGNQMFWEKEAKTKAFNNGIDVTAGYEKAKHQKAILDVAKSLTAQQSTSVKNQNEAYSLIAKQIAKLPEGTPIAQILQILASTLAARGYK